MSDYLLTAEWKKVIGSSPPSEAVSLTKRLERYWQLNGKSESAGKVVALQEITELALSLKKKLAKDTKVVAHLDKMAREAQETKKKVEAGAAGKNGAAARLGKDLVLIKMLALTKRLKPERPSYFVLALGEPSGLVIAKRLSVSHREQARQARTRNSGRKGGGKLLMGRCYGEDGKVVFELGIKPGRSAKPPAGLAANVKRTIKKQTRGGSTVKVIVRGASQDLDGDTDTERPKGKDRAPKTPRAKSPRAKVTLDAEYARRRAEIAPRLLKAVRNQGPDVARMQAVFDLAEKRASEGSYRRALADLAKVEGLLTGARSDSPPGAKQGKRPVAGRLEAYKHRLEALKERYDRLKPLHVGAGLKDVFKQAVTAVAGGNAEAAEQALDTLDARLTTAERTARVASEIGEAGDDAVAYRVALLKWQKCRTKVRDSVEKLIKAILADPETQALDKKVQDQIAAAVPTLRNEIAAFDDTLDTAVNGYLNAPGAQKPRAMKRIRKAIDAYRSALANPVLLAMEDSGFGGHPVANEIETILEEFEELLVR